MTTVEEFLRPFPPPQRRALNSLRAALQRLLPGAEEVLAWGMPTYRIDGDLVVSFSGFSDHNSLFPGPGIIVALSGELTPYTTTKGTIHIPRDTAAPLPLLRQVVRARITQINASYPKASGITKEFYDNGYLTYRGRVREGLQQGSWTFYRRDGSPLRSGSFAAGHPVGEWTTYTRDGAPHRVTDMGR